MSDPRRTFIITTLQQALGEGKSKEWEQDQHIGAFIEDAEASVLVGGRNEAGVIKIGASSEDVQKALGSTSECEVCLVKRVFGSIPTKDMHSSVVVTTTSGSALLSFYLSLQNVYGPKLLSGASTLDPKMQQALMDLQAGLKKLALKTTSGNESKTADEKDASAIQSFNDEFLFWNGGGSLSGPGQADRAAQIAKILEPCTAVFQSLGKATDQTDVFAFINDVCEVLNTLFGELKYPQGRMEHFLSVIGGHFCAHIKTKLPGNLWRDNFSTVREGVSYCIRLCTHWIEARKQLTEVKWKGKWLAKEAQADQLTLMKTRLEDVPVCEQSTRSFIVSCLPKIAKHTSSPLSWTPFLHKTCFKLDPMRSPSGRALLKILTEDSNLLRIKQLECLKTAFFL